MSFSKLVEIKNNFKFNPNNSCKNLYKGACVKIKNSQKTFQVVGINQITLQTYCSETFNEK